MLFKTKQNLPREMFEYVDCARIADDVMLWASYYRDKTLLVSAVLPDIRNTYVTCPHTSTGLRWATVIKQFPAVQNNVLHVIYVCSGIDFLSHASFVLSRIRIRSALGRTR